MITDFNPMSGTFSTSVAITSTGFQDSNVASDVTVRRTAAVGDLTFFDVPMSEELVGLAAGSDGSLWFTENDIDTIGRIRPSGAMTHFPVPGVRAPRHIASASDGALWFTTESAHIGRITTQGAVSIYPLPAPAQLDGIAPGPDGSVWFPYRSPIDGNSAIGRITVAGALSFFPIPSGAEGITTGSDGNRWYTGSYTGVIGRLTPSGQVMEFPIPSGGLPRFIAPGPGGDLWFTAYRDGADIVGRITTAGQITETAIAGTSDLIGIAAGPDGNIWFTERDNTGAASIDQLTPDSVLSRFAFDGTSSTPLMVATGADGNIWATLSGSGHDLVRVTVETVGRTYVQALASGFAPASATLALGRTVQWDFVGPSIPGVEDVTGLGLFGSPPDSTIGEYYSFAFFGAGTYPYESTTTSFAGTISVPLKVTPKAGRVSTLFTVTWGSMTPPTGFVFDTQVMSPSARKWTNWRIGETAVSGTFAPTAVGTYSFRGRLRESSGPTSGWSPVASISVST